MSETKFTPGPWEWDSGLIPPDGPGRYADVYVDGGDKIIASFNEMREFSPAEGRANAHLIAAAPDLYAAAKASVEAYDEMVASLGDDEFSAPAPGSLDSPDITLARTALSRARGEAE
jgi:hypothetical protein